MKAYQPRVQMDCNWIVKQTEESRKELREKLLIGVVGLEARLDVKIKVRLMDYNEINKALSSLKMAAA